MLNKNLHLVRRQMDTQLRLRTLSWYSLFVLLIQPVIFSGIGLVLSRMAGNEAPDITYTVIGGGLLGLWSNTLFTSFFDITQDRSDKTLELIVGSPTSLSTILAIRVLTNVLASFVSLVGAFLIAVILFDYSFPLTNLPPVFLSTVIVLFAFWCMGIFLANFHAWSRASATMANFLEFPVAIFSGFLFPISILPNWFGPVSAILPSRWAVSALYGFLGDTSTNGKMHTSGMIWWEMLVALGLSLLYLILARRLAHFVHDQIRITGELSSV